MWTMFTFFTAVLVHVNATSAPSYDPTRTRVAIAIGETSAGKSELLNLMCDRVGRSLFTTGQTTASETSTCQEEQIQMRLPQIATYLDRELESTRKLLARTSLGRNMNALENVLEFVQTRRDSPLVVIDTPGLNDSHGRDLNHGVSITNKIQDIQNRFGGIDQFIIVVHGGNGAAPRFTNSLKNMLAEFGDNFVGSNQTLTQWLEHVTVVVTHWDYQTSTSSNPQPEHYPGDTSGEFGATREWVSKEINRALAETFGMDQQQQVLFAHTEPVQCVFLDSLCASLCLPDGRTRALHNILDRKLREQQYTWMPMAPNSLAEFDVRTHRLKDTATGQEVADGTLVVLKELVSEAEGEMLSQLQRRPRRLASDTNERYNQRLQLAFLNDPWTNYVQAMALLQNRIATSNTPFQCQHITQGNFVAHRIAAGNLQGIRSNRCTCQEDWSRDFNDNRRWTGRGDKVIGEVMDCHGPGYLCAECRKANPGKAFLATWATGAARGVRYGARGGSVTGGAAGAVGTGYIIYQTGGAVLMDGTGEVIAAGCAVTAGLGGVVGSAVGGVVGVVGGIGHAFFNLFGKGYATTTRRVATLDDGTQIVYSQ